VHEGSTHDTVRGIDAESLQQAVRIEIARADAYVLACEFLADRLGRPAVDAGNFYAYRLLQALGIDTADGVVRASFVHYTTPAEVERLIEALDSLLR
jgi:selenocysteine lyase/cysteine desulfurase